MRKQNNKMRTLCYNRFKAPHSPEWWCPQSKNRTAINYKISQNEDSKETTKQTNKKQ